MKTKSSDLRSIISGISRVESINDILYSMLAIILALIICGLMIFFMGISPFKAYNALLQGSLGSVQAVANTLSKSIPLIFTGLAVALAFRCGLFNIGGEGQLYIGAMTSILIALKLYQIPGFVLLPLAISGGIAVGMLWGGIAGLLKSKFGINEVIVTIMTNYIAILFTSYLVNGPFKAKGMVPQTEAIPGSVSLTKIIPRTQLTTALYIAIAVAILVYWFLWKTQWGYEIRAVGENPTAAAAGGINSARNIILAMALSGGIAALAGITDVMGRYQRFIDGFSPSYGFTGVAVAVLGRNHPLGVILTSLLFAILDSGAMRMTRVTSISANMVNVIQGLVILFVAAPEIINFIARRRRKA